MSEIPEKYRDLLASTALAHLATVMPDGTPQSTPVWFTTEGDLVVFNTAKGRQKDKNLRQTPKVSISIVDPANAYRYVEIRGEIVEITEEGADAMIDSLAKKYLGVDSYPMRNAAETRVTYKVKANKVVGMG